MSGAGELGSLPGAGGLVFVIVPPGVVGAGAVLGGGVDGSGMVVVVFVWPPVLEVAPDVVPTDGAVFCQKKPKETKATKQN